jgi:hypothetical protein
MTSLWLAVHAHAGENPQTIPIRVSVDRQDHSVSYAIGPNAKLRLSDSKISAQLIPLGNAKEGTVFVFLISQNAPLSELDTIQLIVDKYDLMPARFFVCNYTSGQMVELKGDADGLFHWTNHRSPISDSPPKDHPS